MIVKNIYFKYTPKKKKGRSFRTDTAAPLSFRDENAVRGLLVQGEPSDTDRFGQRGPLRQESRHPPGVFDGKIPNDERCSCFHLTFIAVKVVRLGGESRTLESAPPEPMEQKEGVRLIWFGFVWFGSIQSGSVRFSSAVFDPVPFSSFQFGDAKRKPFNRK